MKRTFLRAGVGIVAASLALGLAGCGLGTAGDGASTELSDEPVTIRMYWWGGDARHQRTQEVIDLFEKKHPNITVEAEFSDWNNIMAFASIFVTPVLLGFLLAQRKIVSGLTAGALK